MWFWSGACFPFSVSGMAVRSGWIGDRGGRGGRCGWRRRGEFFFAVFISLEGLAGDFEEEFGLFGDHLDLIFGVFLNESGSDAFEDARDAALVEADSPGDAGLIPAFEAQAP